MAGEFMARFYASANLRKLLMQRNNSSQNFPRVAEPAPADGRVLTSDLALSPAGDKKLHLFQMHRQIDKIQRAM
jgi:hypothetical protein